MRWELVVSKGNSPRGGELGRANDARPELQGGCIRILSTAILAQPPRHLHHDMKGKATNMIEKLPKGLHEM